MKFVKVDKVPGKKANHSLRHYWEEFMHMNIKVAKAEIGVQEYKSPDVARTTWAASIKRFGYPIDLTIRKGEIYLIRRDM